MAVIFPVTVSKGSTFQIAVVYHQDKSGCGCSSLLQRDEGLSNHRTLPQDYPTISYQTRVYREIWGGLEALEALGKLLITLTSS